jgi:hypothetical protein
MGEPSGRLHGTCNSAARNRDDTRIMLMIDQQLQSLTRGTETAAPVCCTAGFWR